MSPRWTPRCLSHSVGVCQSFCGITEKNTSRYAVFFRYHRRRGIEYHVCGTGNVGRTTKTVWRKPKHRRSVQELDEGEVSGITISRRPYRRPSSENAPGPRQTRAAAMTVARAPVDLASNKFRLGDGNHENALPRLISPASAPANGVRYPISSETLLANASKDTPKVTSPSSRQTRK